MPNPIRDWMSQAWNRIASGSTGGRTRITIIGNAVVHDWRNQEVNDRAVLRLLDNLAYDRERFTDHLGGRQGEKELAGVLEKGGELRFVYQPDRNQLVCVTEYRAARRLNRTELDVLLRYTKAQWSDGIGENFASYSFDICGYSVECLPGCQPDPEPSVVQDEATLAPPTPPAFDRIVLLKLSSERGNPRAAFALARCYGEGDGVAMDQVEAVRWYFRAADGGSTQAMVELGLYYLEGKGTAKQPERAVACFRQAAENKGEYAWNGIASGYLGSCFEKGEGVPRDEAEAFRWFLRSSETNVSWLPQLGACYEFGKGVEKNLQQALRCYQEALNAGFDELKPAITRIEALLGKSPK